MFDQADIRGSYLSEQRLGVVKRLFLKERLTVITTIDVFAEEFQSFDEIREEMVVIRRGETLHRERLAEKLLSFGYEKESQVSSRGEFAVRGNIVDVFPYTESAPYRIDLWGDEVESVKVFDAESQRSVETVGEFCIFPSMTESGFKNPVKGFLGNSVGNLTGEDTPAMETAISNAAPANRFFQYFQEDTLFILDEPAKIFSETVPETWLLEEFRNRTCLQFSMLGAGYKALPAGQTVHVNARNITEDLTRWWKI